MTLVAHAEWLQSPSLTVDVDDALQASRWGSAARELKVSTSLALEDDARSEGMHRLAFRAGPLVEERIGVPAIVDLAAVRGRRVAVTVASEPTYAAGAVVFVLGGEVDHAAGVTSLDVLRRL